MSDPIHLATIDEITDGSTKTIAVKGREILLARIDGKFYASDNRCPHMGGRLSEGTLEGTIITCPRHGSQFDLENGNVVRWLKGSGFISTVGKLLKSPKPLNKYDVKIEDNNIMIEI
ncbi:Rieske (2Fe-2S) protein [Chloroflexota bacterium]